MCHVGLQEILEATSSLRELPLLSRSHVVTLAVTVVESCRWCV